MPLIRIQNGTVITPDALSKNTDVLIRGSRIDSVGKTGSGRAGLEKINAKGMFVAPGFIDTHIHGEPAAVLANEIEYGTTAVVLALSCDSSDRIYSKIDGIARFSAKGRLGKAILGVRLEGPFINKKRAGAQDKRYIKGPSAKELSQILKKTRPFLKIITIAPEIKGSKPLLGLLKKNGTIASIGHSDATYEEALEGFDSGITHATHLFNAMSGFDNGERGAATAALVDERVYTEVILDAIHFHPKLFRLLVKVKDLGKIILVTDSVRAENRSSSPLTLPSPPTGGRGEQRGGVVYRFPDGRIAGSALTMIQAVKNAVQIGGLSIIDAVRCATLNPANALGIDSKKGSLAAGKDADVVVFDKRFDVEMTIIGGEIVFKRRGAGCAA